MTTQRADDAPAARAAPGRRAGRPRRRTRRRRRGGSRGRSGHEHTFASGRRAGKRAARRRVRGAMTGFPLTGGCNCGAVRFEVTEPLVAASYCHCKRCQRRSGAAASANAHPAPGTFRIVAGEDRLRVWKPERRRREVVLRRLRLVALRPQPEPRRSDRDPDGRVRRRPGIRPSVRQFVAYAAPWEPIPDDGLPRHPESRHAPG